MKRETIETGLLDELDGCTYDIDGLFNILIDQGFDENPIVSDIMHLGKTLVIDMQKKIHKITDSIRDILGVIEIEREWRPSSCYRTRDEDIVGIKYTASGIMNKILQENGLTKDLCLSLRPGVDLPGHIINSDR